jgi:hypothetical protein
MRLDYERKVRPQGPSYWVDYLILAVIGSIVFGVLGVAGWLIFRAFIFM